MWWENQEILSVEICTITVINASLAPLRVRLSLLTSYAPPSVVLVVLVPQYLRIAARIVASIIVTTSHYPHNINR